MYVRLLCPCVQLHSSELPDDSAAHISEETSNAARAAPIAILTSVVYVYQMIIAAWKLTSEHTRSFTSTFGWLLLIAASYASSSVSDLLTSDLPLPMGQLFLNNLGKEGMLALWSLIIIVQVRIILQRFSKKLIVFISSSLGQPRA
jgi:hypothetical protein